MKNKILPETQKLIDLFTLMPPQAQKDFRQWIDNTDPLNDWGVELDKLEWDIEADKLEWTIEDF